LFVGNRLVDPSAL